MMPTPLAALILLMIPMSACAMKTENFDFSEHQINADWTGQGNIQMQQANNGILLQTGDGTGMLLTSLGADFQPQSGVIEAASPSPSEFYFVWSMVQDPDHTTFTVPFWFGTGAEEEKEFSLREKREWQRGEKKIGVVLPPHTTILLQSIRLEQRNIFEQSLEAVRSLWTFDALRPYTINFVWGPQIGFNPAERNHLYDLLPPVYLSGTLVIAAVVILLIGLLLFLGRKKTKELRWAPIFFMLLVVWIIFDARMGAEFLTWVWHDHQTYISAEPGQREFRDRDAFYDFADFALPLVADRSSYVFFAERPWPYLGNMRYLTYPSIPGIDYLKDDTWVIYRRSDMSIDSAGQMTIDGEPISPPGNILGRFDDSSFIFRVSK